MCVIHVSKTVEICISTILEVKVSKTFNFTVLFVIIPRYNFSAYI